TLHGSVRSRRMAFTDVQGQQPPEPTQAGQTHLIPKKKAAYGLAGFVVPRRLQALLLDAALGGLVLLQQRDHPPAQQRQVGRRVAGPRSVAILGQAQAKPSGALAFGKAS